MPGIDIDIVQDGSLDAPVLLLLQNNAAPIALWDPVIAPLASTHRILRVDLLGVSHGVPAQARQLGAAMDKLGAQRLTAVGHSSGGMAATSLAEQRPDQVTALALINTGPSPAAKFPDPPLARLLTVPLAGRLLWQLKTEATVRKAASTAFTRPIDIPDAFVSHLQAMSYRPFTTTMRGYREYLSQRSIPDRLADLGLPVLVIFGADDRRWRSSSAADYRDVPGVRIEMLPGVGHTPIVEDPVTTARLLLEFAASQADHGAQQAKGEQA